MKKLTILHIEDDPALAKLVRMALESMGFRGNILHAPLVAAAITLLTEMERREEALDLILVDMELPDGNGLDIVRRMKESTVWHRTPVIVLSGETGMGLINEAYALGANCYLPKFSRKGVLGSIQALYHCWIEGALLPRPAFANRIHEALAKGIQLRARTAQFYLGLARACAAGPEQEGFWLERALIEGNTSNLLAFFQGQLSDEEVPAGMVERLAAMQIEVEKALTSAEVFLMMTSSPTPMENCRHVLDLMEAWDEEVIADIFGALFPKNPAVTIALKARAVCQLRELANHVLRQTQEPDLHRRAKAQLAFADRLAAAVCSTESKAPGGAATHPARR